MSTRDMLLDVMSDVDPVFITEHISRARTTRAQHISRYAIPAAIYAAVCAVVLLVLPHIIGTSPDEPPVKPDVPIAVETIVTSETEEITETVTESETEAITTEAITSEAEITEEVTVPPPTEYIPEEPVQTDPPETETSTVTTEIQYLPKNFNKYDVRRLTVEDCGAQIVSGCTYNEYYNGITPMCDITFWESVKSGDTFYRNRYDYTVDTNTGKIISEKKTERDETFTPNESGAYKTNGQFYYESFGYYYLYNPYKICGSVKRESPVRIESITELNEFIAEINSADPSEFNDENSDTAMFVKDLQCFDEEFFESNTLFFDFMILSSGSIGYSINKISLDNSGVLQFNFNLVKPAVMDCMMDGNICAFAFDKDFLKGVKDVKKTVNTIQKKLEIITDAPNEKADENAFSPTTVINPFTGKNYELEFKGNGEITIILTHEESINWREYTPDDFPKLELEKIETWEPMSDDQDFINSNSEYQNFVSIFLKDKRDEAVVDAMEYLYGLDFVHWAGPEYYQ